MGGVKFFSLAVESPEGDADKERFPLKLRDAGQAAAIAYIRSKGLIPDEDSDDYIPDPEAAGIEW
jgi:hypothetical protein